MKKIVGLAVALAGIVALSGCGKNTAESSDSAEAVTTVAETTVEATTETEETEPAEESETEAVTESETTPAIETGIGSEEEALQWFDSDVFSCGVEVPTGWTATSGVTDGKITDGTSVFQPAVPNGDSISLMVQNQAEDAATFDSLTEADLASAYTTSIENVMVTELQSVLVDDYSAYRMTITGNVGDMPLSISQLMVNCPDAGDSGRLYILSYTNVSGEPTSYTEALETQLHLKDE